MHQGETLECYIYHYVYIVRELKKVREKLEHIAYGPWLMLEKADELILAIGDIDYTVTVMKKIFSFYCLS